MQHLESVKKLRAELQTRRKPGVYRWWFREDIAEDLLNGCFGLTSSDGIFQKEIDGKSYLALYFGISPSLDTSLNWHICQHQQSAALSTLRVTLCTLLTESKFETSAGVIEDGIARYIVDAFIDNSCYIEWEHTATEAEAEEIEQREFDMYWYPLNIRKNNRAVNNTTESNQRKDVKLRLIKLRKKAIIH